MRVRSFACRLVPLFVFFMLGLAAHAEGQEVPGVVGVEVETRSPSPVVQTEADGLLSASGALLSGSELEALGLDVSGARVDTDFHFSGFVDFTSVFPVEQARGVNAASVPRYQSFYVGNINLYLSKNLSDSFRTMTEVRLTYLPNGTPQLNPTGLSYQDTQALDYADNSRATRWGGIILQRVYLEWTLHRLAVVRGGQFLTPYGIWNVDHGSPAYIPVVRPYAINNGFFPERQTGLEIFGRWDASNESTLGYHLTLSNGSGPISEYHDLDRNKAIGARMYWEYRRVGFFRMGASGYYGRDTASLPAAQIAGDRIRIGEAISSQYDNLALAADLLLKVRGFHIQGEWVSQQRRYTDAGRSLHELYVGPVPKAFSIDSLSWAGYGLLAYQFDWFAFTPYLMVERSKQVLPSLILDAKLETRSFHVGINVHPNDAVTFKLEYVRVVSAVYTPFFGDPYALLQLQAAWAF